MGNSSSKKEDLKVEWPDLKLSQLKIENDTLIGRVPVHSKQEYDDWVKKLEKNPAGSAQNAFNPIKHEFEEGGMCGSGGFANLTYENFPYRISQEMANRKSLDYDSFKESDLWYILYEISDLGKKYHESGYKIGDISPEHIVTNEEGAVQILNQFSWPDFRTNYDKFLYEKQISYVSPEELKELYLGRSNPETDDGKSEAFSTGLTVIEAALGTDSHRHYNKKLSFDFEGLNVDKVNLMNEPQYSNDLKHVILNLTEFQPEDRMSLTELNSFLRPYENQILNSESFKVQSMPSKLNQTVMNNPIKVRTLNFYDDNPGSNQANTQTKLNTAVVDLFDSTKRNDQILVQSERINNTEALQSGNLESAPIYGEIREAPYDVAQNTPYCPPIIVPQSSYGESRRASYSGPVAQSSFNEARQVSYKEPVAQSSYNQARQASYKEPVAQSSYNEARQVSKNEPVAQTQISPRQSVPANFILNEPVKPVQNERPYSFGVAQQSGSYQPTKASRPLTSTTEIAGGPTRSSRPKSNFPPSPRQTLYLPPATQAGTETILTPTVRQTINSDPMLPLQNQTRQTISTPTYVPPIPQAVSDTYVIPTVRETISSDPTLPAADYRSSYSRQATEQRQTYEIPSNPEIVRPQFRIGSNMPSIPKSPRQGNNEQFLKMIETKIKNSRETFPSSS